MSRHVSRAAAAERLLQRLDWHVVRKLDGLLQGEYRSLFRGPGIDLANLREYQPGDDVRYIDWNVTARLTTPYVREYHEDREITAWFLLDLSPSVDFGTVADGRHKRAVLVDFVTTLARVLTRRGNRIGAIVYGQRVERTIPAGTGRRAGAAIGRRPAAPADPPASPGDEPGRAPGGRTQDDQAPLVRGDRVRLHQRAGLGAAPAPAGAAARVAGRAARRSAGADAARRRPGRHRGRRDRRAALRRYRRPGVPRAVRGGRT